MAEKDILDRALYKRIKSMNKSDMQDFLKKIYSQGFDEALNGTAPNLEKIRERIGNIKGIGETRLNEIMTIIEEEI